MRGNAHVRFGGRGRADHRAQTRQGGSPPTLHRDRPPHPTQRQTLAVRRNGAALLRVPARFAPRGVYDQIESLNSIVRKAVRIRGHFPDDESARKLVYLAIRNHESNWKRPMAGWYECLAAFHAHFQDRLTRQS